MIRYTHGQDRIPQERLPVRLLTSALDIFDLRTDNHSMSASRTITRRRTRFTATIQRPGTGVTRKVILAYEAASVRAHYERLGWTVLQITRGDYRTRERQQARVATRPRGGWTLDRPALAEAIELLGIKLPVEIKQTGGQPGVGRHGAHGLRPSGGSVRIQGGRCYNTDTATGIGHHITVKSWLTPDEAGRTLWHELAHCAQSERVMNRLPDSATIRDCIMAWHRAYRNGVSYEHKSWERDARDHEPMNDDLPLAR